MSDSIFLTDGNGTITGIVDNSYAGELVIPEYIGGERITTIEEWAFSTCNYLTSVVIPDSVISIGYYAFTGCTSLTSITIPDSVTSIGTNAFCECISLTSVTIPSSVVNIDDFAFSDCTSLTTVYVPDPNNLSEAVGSYDWTKTGSSGITFLQDPRYIDYLIKGGSLINLADKIRILLGTEDTMTPDETVEALNIQNAEELSF